MLWKLTSSLPIKRPSDCRLTFGGENRTTALAGAGDAPLLVLTHHLSPGGGTLLATQLRVS